MRLQKFEFKGMRDEFYLAFSKVTSLVKGDLLRGGESHSVFKVEIRFAIEIERLVGGLNNTFGDVER